MIETDSGWGDSIWRSGTSRSLAIAVTVAGAAAAATAIVMAIHYREQGRQSFLRGMFGALLVEVLLAATWIALAAIAP